MIIVKDMIYGDHEEKSVNNNLTIYMVFTKVPDANLCGKGSRAFPFRLLWDKEIHCSLIKICCPFLVKSVKIYMVFTKALEADLAGVAPKPFFFS